ncbi:expressed unknown protein [Seminavis robusta]|uniref:Uncharacterized protein n=1 Tax=Seminavis robusta TaxID=568900 RepID=A0A9N8EQC0_9STRA|nr:expressed unknown protein [Seminavis robusta]|eukprot:Sro1431_g272070.1 n/a (146) ;mRNA; r:28385-28822
MCIFTISTPISGTEFTSSEEFTLTKPSRRLSFPIKEVIFAIEEDLSGDQQVNDRHHIRRSLSISTEDLPILIMDLDDSSEKALIDSFASALDAFQLSSTTGASSCCAMNDWSSSTHNRRRSHRRRNAMASTDYEKNIFSFADLFL